MKKRDLPKNCYPRGNKIWLRYKDEHGNWVSKKTPYRLEQVEQARQLVTKILRGVERKLERGSSNPSTIAEYAEAWLKDREARGVASAQDDRRRMKYALEHIGHLPLEEVRPRHIRDMVRKLKLVKMENGEPLAARTIHHIYNGCYTMFQTAIVDELIWGENPVKVQPGELPKKQDKDPEWRSEATYHTKEITKLISSPIIPQVRRVKYGLKALAGMRHGEAAALCWRHRNKMYEPYPKLNIVQAWDSRENKIKDTKTGETREVPEHPTLTRLLDRWEIEWERVYGKKPGPDDLVIPTQTGRCMAAKDAGDAHKRDLEVLGLRVKAGKKRSRGGHDMRAWFLTQAIEDGGDSLLIRRMTHSPPKGVGDLYERFSWEAKCRELGKLKVELEGEPLALATESLQSETKARGRWRNSVTPKGLEPPPNARKKEVLYAPLAGSPSRNRPQALIRDVQAAAARSTRAVTTPLQTLAAMLERAISVGDGPRVLEIAKQLRELGGDDDIREHMRKKRAARQAAS